MTARRIEILPLGGLPEIGAGDDLGGLIAAAADLREGDVVVVAQKVVSKAEGAVVALGSGQDPATVRRRLAAEGARRVVVDAPWALVVQTVHGLVCANAGIDASNAAEGTLVLLPPDPDASARRLRDALLERTGVRVAVIVSDTFGRPWRVGQTDVAIGVAGLHPIRDERGSADWHGRPLEVTETAVADELAGAADLARRKADGVPVVVVRGLDHEPTDDASARDLVRPAELDLFPYGRGILATRLAEGAWPPDLAAGVSAAELERLRPLAPDLELVDAGPPARLWTADPLAGGLVAAALVDMGHAVRWRRDAGGVEVAAGRP